MAKTLLLADDSVTIQKVVGISFANEDISITTVDNGDDALAKAKEIRPDVVLADVVMPGKSGYEVCEGIKADPELNHIPVLLLTGTFEAFDDERAARIGAAGHVAKPFEAQTLVDRVKELLGRGPVAAPAAPAPPEPAKAAPPSGDSFDFFDDDLGDGASRDTAIEGTTTEPSLDDSLSLESSDAAFAFGDDDLAAATPAEKSPDSTIAILPDNGPQQAAAASAAEPALTTVDSAMFEATPEPSPAAAPPPPAATAKAEYDFEFQTASPEPPQAPADAPLGSEDLSQATILDPQLGSNFAVSSSDLDSTLSPTAAAPAAPAGAPAQGNAPTAPPLPAAPIAEPDLEPLSSDLLGAEPLLEPSDAPLAQATGAPVDSVLAEPAQILEASPATTTGAQEAPVSMAPLPGSAAAATPQEATPGMPELIAIAEPLPPAATPEPIAPAVEPMAAAAMTEQIAPALRAELHQTLEKIAWESFGQITEKIVQEVIQKLERVAWDVVPKLAESLIQEEIRKLKGEPE